MLLNLIRRPWVRFFALPVVLGLIVASVTLALNPELGARFAAQIYNSNKDVQGYAFAVARSSPSVVNIYVSRLNNDYTGIANDRGEITNSASGVIMSADGYILTNYHVIPSLSEPNKAVWVQTTDGIIRQAFIVGYDRRTDLAVLKIQAQNLTPIPINPNYVPHVGDIVLAIGNPNNLGQTVTHGIISATARTGSGLLTRERMNIREGLQDLIQTDAPINAGNSGGALVNTNGELVGINTASFDMARVSTYGIGFAIPTKLAVYVMKEILRHGRVIRGYLGISDENSQFIADHSVQGVMVRYIDPAGPAAMANIQLGDIIVKVNNIQINNVRELIEVISSTRPGTVLNLTVKRGNQYLIAPVTLAEDRPNID